MILARRTIERGEAPLDNRDTAIELHPDVRLAAAEARDAPDVAYEVGDEVAAWLA